MLPLQKSSKAILKPVTKQSLIRLVRSLEAQLPCNLYTAYRELDKLTADKYLGSGLIIQITNYSGYKVCEPFLCADGLAPDTIMQLKIQISNTLDLQKLLKPKEL